MKKFYPIRTIVILSFLFVSCEERKQVVHWDTFVDNFIAVYLELNPTEAVDAGLHEYDGEFPDWSSDGIQTLVDWLHVQKDSLDLYIFDTREKKQQFEKQYLKAIIDKKLFWLETVKTPFTNPSFYLDAISPSVYLTRKYAPPDVRMKALITYENNLPEALMQMKANLQLPLPFTFAELGRNVFKGYVNFFNNDLPLVFSSVDNEELQQELAIANELAIESVKELHDWFERILPKSNGTYALGSERFKEMLWVTEKIDISSEDLKIIGEVDLERNLAALEQACQEFAPDKSIKECIEKVHSNKPEGGAVEGAAKQLSLLKEFVVKNNVVSIPVEEEILVEEAPPYNRWNFAYISIPGVYEDRLPSVYYIAPPDPSWSREMQRGYIPGKTELLFVSVHEVWPGHFLQSLHRNKSKYKIGKVFWGYAYGEGWAHYSEEMMYNEGLGNFAPEYKIGQLTYALLRNIRFLSSIGLHTEGMTVEESERMFINKGFINPGEAKQQAARGTFDPVYLNYTMGKLIIMKLRSDWLSANPDKTLKDFHDEFLSYGGPPIVLVRTEMMGSTEGSLF
ncbi:MAG: DUF885 domain-containing protein [Ignavibacteriaceae bacterium]